MSNDSDQTSANRGQTPVSNQEMQTVAERQPVLRAPVREPVRQPVREPILTAPRPVEVRRVQEERGSNAGEYVKFGILAVVLLGTPVVIALLIPLIFGQIVPAVLGSDLPASAPVVPGDQVVEPEPGEQPGGVPGEPETGVGGEGTQATITPPAPTETPSGNITHVVRTGETLAAIGRQYGVTAGEIAAANNLANPNQIFAGQILVIPQPGSP